MKPEITNRKCPRCGLPLKFDMKEFWCSNRKCDYVDDPIVQMMNDEIHNR